MSRKQCCQWVHRMVRHTVSKRLMAVLLALLMPFMTPISHSSFLISHSSSLISHFSSAYSSASAQQFVALTAQQVRIDSTLPSVSYVLPLPADQADSVYRVQLLYPEFMDLEADEVVRLRALISDSLPPMPVVRQHIGIDRRRPRLYVEFSPIVYRDGRYQRLVSFLPRVESQPRPQRAAARQQATAASRYRERSVLSEGVWAKVRVSASGIHQITPQLLRQAGFTDMSRIRVYGYGGAPQPEVLTDDYLRLTDDLPEVAVAESDGRLLFHAQGPVAWSDSHQRLRNPYSDYGYYFLTESDSSRLTISVDSLMAASYPLTDDHCTLLETDDYAWYHGGRNLYDSRQLLAGNTYRYTVEATGAASEGSLTVVLSAEGGATVGVTLNDSLLGSITIPANGTYETMRTAQRTYTVSGLQASNTLTLTPAAGSGTVRLDYISTYSPTPRPAPDLGSSLPTPEYVYHITPQNHHGATAADMVIVIPTSQQTLAAAQRLQALHASRDGLRVQIVPADELYNEFASGTPDANAYRRYLKMLYDRADSEADMPRYLLLLGDGAWDNRMRSSAWTGVDTDDFLLCYESENSYSETSCFVSDDYFALMDDGEGGSLLTADKADVAVGRIPARSAEEAAIMVDKIERYVANSAAGAWQSVVCFMGDDGNENQHMKDADEVASLVEQSYPELIVKRIMWDAYQRVSSSTGNSYPDVTRAIKQQMQQGALMMNYSGHGRADAMSHEYVLRLTDFTTTQSAGLPLWMTASCDIMPFDGQEENIGETALFNDKGGAIAFYGTTRTVYQNYNRMMNLAFTRHVLARDADGRPLPIGEAVRKAKNELISSGSDHTANKLQYTLLGDPAMRLAVPSQTISIDSINHQPLSADVMLTLPAGSKATVTGRVLDSELATDSTFTGLLAAVVRGASQLVTCRQNDRSTDGASEAFTYYDRTSTVFNGSDSVRQGQFCFTFAVPKDILYSDLPALLNIHAVNDQRTAIAGGSSDRFALNGSATDSQNNVGPSIYCYLNSADFTNGDVVNATPYFVAQLADEDGINVAGSGIGHDLQLTIDGDAQQTYTLNDYFQYDFGSYTSGTLGYSLPQMTEGSHRLTFRAWDILNNSSTVELLFDVARSLSPTLADIDCTPNPARTTTTFRIVHDRMGSTLDVRLDILDTSGRLLWQHAETGTATDNTYSITWDLTTSNGRRLPTGLYLYRLTVGTDGERQASKTRKLIVLTGK